MEPIYTLIQKAQQGDEQAKEQILQENNGLIWSVVRRFSGRAEQDDLYQLGAIGLLKCIDKFDTTYNVKFSTYAVPMIIGEIRRFLRDDGAIKVSRSLKELAYRAKKIQDKHMNEENREPTITELAIELEVDVEELILAMEAQKNIESIYAEKGNHVQPLLDRLGDSEESEKRLECLSLKEAINHLNTKEKNVIILRYFQDKTQTDVAKLIGISQVQVSRIEKKALLQMRESMK